MTNRTEAITAWNRAMGNRDELSQVDHFRDATKKVVKVKGESEQCGNTLNLMA